VIVHEPVLLQEVLGFLVPPAEGGLLLDATLGQGGHAEAFLARYPRLLLVGVDADAAVLETARARLSPFSGRARLVNAWFGTFLSEYAGEREPDLILMDLGISRFHYEASGRGFSFDREEALDMRLSEDLPVTAADIVNTSEPPDLADILFRYGEERHAHAIVARIVRERTGSPISSSSRLAAIVSAAVPAE
jgi:16S rRNA (cytosine1402-N4)-methyltransferase